jgi:hypothetical protein
VRPLANKLAVILLAALSGTSAWALPTMIRLGYPNCVSCHITPQGGGLLNTYGRGIDQAQSYQAGDYKPSTGTLGRLLTFGGRTRQDVRWVGQEAASAPTNDKWATLMRNRFFYRNATELGKGFRISLMVTGETRSIPRPNKSYDLALVPGSAMVSTALLNYRPKEGIEMAAGRDLLPTGLFIADLSSFIRSRNRAGYYDTPTQAKAFIWGKRYQITPYAFGPGGHETRGQRETGGGTLAEFDLLGKQKTVVGLTALHGSAQDGNRRILGGYTRLGFGKWGILAEHDITDRTIKANAVIANNIGFRQHTSYVQAFWAVREWLVPSLIGEQVSVARPYREDLRAGKLEIAARLSSQVTLSGNFRMQRNVVTGVWAPSVGFQVAMKPVF